MKSLFLAFLLIPVFLPKTLLGQDSLITTYSNRAKFETYIGYLYHDCTNNMTPELRSNVDSIFEQYDFSDQKYRCQYRLGFIAELDSCGRIWNCYPGKGNHSEGDLAPFQQDICKMILQSNTQIANWVVMEDTSYYIDAALFFFETSCDPDEIIFQDTTDAAWNYKYILKNEEEEIHFNGFQTICDED